jgi:hypothetical protein
LSYYLLFFTYYHAGEARVCERDSSGTTEGQAAKRRARR